MTDKLTAEIELLERHIRMLMITKANQPIGIIRLSELLGVPKHKVRYSLRLLENEGLISPSSDGAMVTEKYDEYMASVSKYLDEIESAVSRIRTEMMPK